MKSLRAQILLILLGGAVLPLGIVGLWLTSSGVRSAESLLRSHLDESADRLAAVATSRWEYRRGDAALLAANDASVRAVTNAKISATDSTYLDALAVSVSTGIPSVELRDTLGRLRWATSPAIRAAHSRDAVLSLASSPPERTLRMELPVNDASGRLVGKVLAFIAMSALIPSDSARPLVPGGAAVIRDSRSGDMLVPMTGHGPRMPFTSSEYRVAGQRWFSTTRHLSTLPLDIAVTAPAAPYVAPFERASRLGLGALFLVAGLAIVLSVVFATRVTRPLEALARASGAVADGNLAQEVRIAGPTEVRQVGAAFNVMTDNLRDTLDALSRRSVLAAVGEFATSLSHDVRNALTSIKVDLDRLAMRDIKDPVAEGLVGRALNNVSRLEASVAGALRVARRGHTPLVDADLRGPIHAAAETVSGTMAAIPATLDLALPAEPVIVRGDPAALEQLFANLLFNAAQSLAKGGHTSVRLDVVPEGVTVAIRDTGSGLTREQMEKLNEPFFSSKPNGTGLGLPIARQIVAAHGGELTIESEPGVGTTIRIRLPHGPPYGTSHSSVLNEPITRRGGSAVA